MNQADIKALCGVESVESFLKQWRSSSQWYRECRTERRSCGSMLKALGLSGFFVLHFFP